MTEETFENRVASAAVQVGLFGRKGTLCPCCNGYGLVATVRSAGNGAAVKSTAWCGPCEGTGRRLR